MSLLTLGLNHQTAPVKIREQVNFGPDQLSEALSQARNIPGVDEVVILSTCNRTEIYTEAKQEAEPDLSNWLAQYHDVRSTELHPYLYRHHHLDAINHTLRVASGLDSMVLGEPQILGQLKQAFDSACSADSVKTILGRLFQHAFTVAKRVRTDTEIGNNPVSVAYSAVTLARQIFGELNQYTALMIGAGETIELAVRHLHRQGIGKIVIANRTRARAETLAEQFGAEAISIGEIGDHLPFSDIVISSTASQLPILGKGATETALKKRKHRPIFMVDLAVPRDIEAQVGELDDVYLYTVDDLHEVIEENRKSREAAAAQAEEIIQVEVDQFDNWLRKYDAADHIRQLRTQAAEISELALQKATAQLARGEPVEQVMQQLAENLAKKYMHGATVQMRKAIEDNDEHRITGLLQLFKGK